MAPLPPTIPARVDLLERLSDQQSALNDLTRQALATLDEALRVQQRSLERYGASLDRHAAALDLLARRSAEQDATLDLIARRMLQHDEVLARLDGTLAAIKDLLERGHNGTP